MSQKSDVGSCEARRRVLVTGGSGSIGMALARYHGHEFEIHSVSRGPDAIQMLSEQFPDVRTHQVDIRDAEGLKNLFLTVRPDIVIHAAALKHVNQAEVKPTLAVEINVLGTLNVVNASIAAKVPVSVAISTDKACQPDNIYGYTKKITEQVWLEHHRPDTRFVCARFANVASSDGSVIPLWINSALAGETLKLTDSRMNRLMFTPKQAIELVNLSIDFALMYDEPFVLARIMKAVNMLELANVISAEFGDGRAPEIVGVRPGERLNEVLVSQAELGFAYRTQDRKHIMLHSSAAGVGRLTEELSSLTADYMNKTEIRELYADYVKSRSIGISGESEVRQVNRG